jgi:hypothetical protein
MSRAAAAVVAEGNLGSSKDSTDCSVANEVTLGDSAQGVA